MQLGPTPQFLSFWARTLKVPVRAPFVPGTVLGVLLWCHTHHILGDGWHQVIFILQLSKQAGLSSVLQRAEPGLGATRIKCCFHTSPWARPEVTQLRTLPSGGVGARDLLSDHPSPGEGSEGL